MMPKWAAFCAGALIAGCVSMGPAAPNLVGTSWHAESISGAPVSGNGPHIAFSADGRVTGNAGCNSMFAGYETHGAAITISNVGSTRMACAPPIMTQEQAFLRALAGAVRYDIAADGKLRLSAESGQNVVLAPAP